MKNIKRILYGLLAFVPLLAPGCGGGTATVAVFEDTLYMPLYADGFAIMRSGSSSVLSVSNPWQGAEGIAMQLFLSRDGERPPEGFTGMVAEAPLKNVVCMSSSYVAFIDELGEIDAVKAVSGARYITNGVIRSRYSDGGVRDVGYDANVNYELIASLRPDMVFIYGVTGGNSAMTRKFDEMSVPYMYIGDYVEQSPLGKAEWLVAFGEMFDRRDEAVLSFMSIRDGYMETCEAVAVADQERALSPEGETHKPSVMLNAPYRDTWFVPGDRSYMVRLITDAGGIYACAGDDSERSRPISAESAFVYADNADVWLNPGQVSEMAELKSQNPRFADIPAVRNGRVFNCNARSTPEGGSDFWESGAVRPDVVLKDMVKMIRPELMPEYGLCYFRKIE